MVQLVDVLDIFLPYFGDINEVKSPFLMIHQIQHLMMLEIDSEGLMKVRGVSLSLWLTRKQAEGTNVDLLIPVKVEFTFAMKTESNMSTTLSLKKLYKTFSG